LRVERSNPSCGLQDGWSEAIPINTVHAVMGFASLYPSYEVKQSSLSLVGAVLEWSRMSLRSSGLL
jgi:hypothetical protein